MSENNSSTQNDDILKRLKASITFSSSSARRESSSESEEEEDPPQALRGISVQGVSGTVLNSLLNKDSEEKPAEGGDENIFINEWSKRCLSISFANKKSKESSEESSGNESDEETVNNKTESNDLNKIINSSNLDKNSLEKSELGGGKSVAGVSLNQLPFSSSISFSSISVSKPQLQNKRPVENTTSRPINSQSNSGSENNSSNVQALLDRIKKNNTPSSETKSNHSQDQSSRPINPQSNSGPENNSSNVQALLDRIKKNNTPSSETKLNNSQDQSSRPINPQSNSGLENNSSNVQAILDRIKKNNTPSSETKSDHSQDQSLRPINPQSNSGPENNSSDVQAILDRIKKNNTPSSETKSNHSQDQSSRPINPQSNSEPENNSSNVQAILDRIKKNNTPSRETKSNHSQDQSSRPINPQSNSGPENNSSNVQAILDRIKKNPPTGAGASSNISYDQNRNLQLSISQENRGSENNISNTLLDRIKRNNLLTTEAKSNFSSYDQNSITKPLNFQANSRSDDNSFNTQAILDRIKINNPPAAEARSTFSQEKSFQSQITGSSTNAITDKLVRNNNFSNLKSLSPEARAKDNLIRSTVIKTESLHYPLFTPPSKKSFNSPNTFAGFSPPRLNASLTSGNQDLSTEFDSSKENRPIEGQNLELTPAPSTDLPAQDTKQEITQQKPNFISTHEKLQQLLENKKQANLNVKESRRRSSRPSTPVEKRPTPQENNYTRTEPRRASLKRKVYTPEDDSPAGTSGTSSKKCFECPYCKKKFTRVDQDLHIEKCKAKKTQVVLGSPRHETARKKTASVSVLKCLYCNSVFHSEEAFELHHKTHVSDIRVVAVKIPEKELELYSADLNSACSSNSATAEESETESEKGANSLSQKAEGLKLTLKRSAVANTKFEIVNSHEQSRTVYYSELDSMIEQSGRNNDPSPFQAPSELQNNATPQMSNSSSCMVAAAAAANNTQPNQTGPQLANDYLNPSAVIHYPADNTNTAQNRESQPPNNNYAPQFEEFSSDWYGYDDGQRIAAAIAGAGADPSQSFSATESYNSAPLPPHSSQSPNTVNTTLASPFISQNSYQNNEVYTSSYSQSPIVNGTGSNSENSNSSTENSSMFNETGSSGTTLGSTADNRDLGSFEELCLNEPYNQSQISYDQSSSDNFNANQSFQNSTQGNEDVLSQLAYSDGDRTQQNVPSSGLPQTSPSPTDTSFRALASSPSSMDQTSPASQHSTPPLRSPITSTSPLEQMAQLAEPGASSSATDTPSVPRLTIANNLLATTSANVGFGHQWSAPAPVTSSLPNFPNTYLAGTNAIPSAMGSPLTNNLTNQGRFTVNFSPCPRVRGRPPLIDHVNRLRPQMLRSPVRGSLPPLRAAPGSANRNLMQRNQNFRQMTGQKRPNHMSNQSPNKIRRTEDIPSIQKDNECEIIAVQDKSNGLVIKDIQGGSAIPDRRSSSSSSSSVADSPIRLSDSITLSVKPTTESRTEKRGEASQVTNLLASRGITVAPAEKEQAPATNVDNRRIPSASELNLSSAISVHPPTSRDREGFAVPHPPTSTRAPAVERPERPPTVDLTQEVSPTGSQATRALCSQCDKTFPNQALLADHAKVHQQQSQASKPYKCHLCTAGFTTQKGQQHHYQQFHLLHMSQNDLAIPVVDFKNTATVQRMARLGIRTFMPLNHLQNRGAGGSLGIPLLTLENIHNNQMNLQQWGINDVLTMGAPRTMNVARSRAPLNQSRQVRPSQMGRPNQLMRPSQLQNSQMRSPQSQNNQLMKPTQPQNPQMMRPNPSQISNQIIRPPNVPVGNSNQIASVIRPPTNVQPMPTNVQQLQSAAVPQPQQMQIPNSVLQQPSS